MKKTPKKVVRAGAKRARRTGERAIMRVVNGVDYVLADRADVVEPEPYDVVFQQDKLILRSYPAAPPEELGLGAEGDPEGLDFGEVEDGDEDEDEDMEEGSGDESA